MQDYAPKGYKRDSNLGLYISFLIFTVLVVVTAWGLISFEIGRDPGQFKWLDVDGKTVNCLARVERGGSLVPCSEVPPKELNKLHLEWTNPNKIK